MAAIAAGATHTCAVTTAGALLCWGDNSGGELGTGTGSPTASTVPVAVMGLSSGVAAISAGGPSTCALTTTGGVLCWGADLGGKLGFVLIGGVNAANYFMPLEVTTLPAVTAIAVGGYQTCAVTAAGGALCWGDDSDGELGDGTSTNTYLPVKVAGLSSGVAAIAAGMYHTCALTTAGAVQCWGFNDLKQLGDGTTTSRHVPVAVTGLSSGVAAIAAGGSHTCALTTAGAVQCWGDATGGDLGDGSLTSGITAIVAGEYHTCARTTAGGVLCWGSNAQGQLGNGSTTASAAPVVAIAP